MEFSAHLKVTLSGSLDFQGLPPVPTRANSAVVPFFDDALQTCDNLGSATVGVINAGLAGSD